MIGPYEEISYLKAVSLRILERVPTIHCTFLEAFIGVFMYCFPIKDIQDS